MLSHHFHTELSRYILKTVCKFGGKLASAELKIQLLYIAGF